MKIHSVEVKGIKQNNGLFTFPPSGIIGIVGANGKGKSNLLLAIKMLLLNEFDGTKRSYINFFEDQGWGKLKATIGDQDIEVERTLYRDNRPDMFKMTIGNKVYSKGQVTEAYDALYSLIGGSSKLLSQIVFAKQKELGKFLFGTPGERKRGFQSLFGLDNIKSANTLVSKELPTLDIQDYKDLMVDLKTEIGEKEDRIEGYKEELGDKKSVEAIDTRLEEISQIINEYDKVQNKISSIQSQRSMVSEDIESLTEEVQDLLTDKIRLENRLKDESGEVIDCDKYTPIIEEYENQEEVRTSTRQLEASLDESVERLRKLINIGKDVTIDGKVIKQVVDRLNKGLEAGKERLDNQVKELDQVKTQVWKLEQLIFISGRQDEIGEPLFGGLDTDNTNVCPLCESDENISEAAANVKIEEYNNLVATLNSLEDKICTNRSKLAEFVGLKRDAEECYTNIEELRAKLEDKKSVKLVSRDEYQKAKQLVQKYSEASTKLSTIDDSIEAGKDKLRAKKKKLSELKVPEEPEEINKKSLAKEKDQLHEEKASIPSLKHRISEVEEEKGKLEKQLEDYQKKDKTNQKLKKYKDVLMEVKEATHPDVLPQMSMHQGIQALNKGFLDKQEQLNFDMQVTVNPKECETLCVPPGCIEPESADVMSPGQETAAAIAFILSLWEDLLPSVDVIALDEPTAYVDREHIGAIVATMHNVKNALSSRQIFLISHEEALESVMDHIIRVGE